jgi:aminopeptidase-like protein
MALASCRDRGQGSHLAIAVKLNLKVDLAGATILKTPRHLLEVIETFDPEREGAVLYDMVRELYPICRSITGAGLRKSLRYLQQTVPMGLREVPTGTPVLDWTVPKEWNIREAWIKDAQGGKVVDFAKCNLHVVNYSIPVRRRIRLAELKAHLFSLPETPDWIPYRTSYYEETWGFCLAHRQLAALKDEEYEVCIDASLEPGHLTYGEYRIDGELEDEVLISCHSCHPSLCNDNLSGMTIAARLAALLTGRRLRYSYRFLWIPGTIGSITWLASNETSAQRVRHGLVLSCLGDRGAFTYKRTRRGDAEIDRAVVHALRDGASNSSILDFVPYGYDERQYCSPGFNLPVGALMRTPNGRYPEYHTSADDLNLVDAGSLGESLAMLLRIVYMLESNQVCRNLFPKGEPQLGRRGLYRSMGGVKDSPQQEMAMLWVLNLSDGDHDLLEIAERAGLDFRVVTGAAERLIAHGLLASEGLQRSSPGLNQGAGPIAL